LGVDKGNVITGGVGIGSSSNGINKNDKNSSNYVGELLRVGIV